MRIFFVLDETVYHPKMLSEFFLQTQDQVVGVAIVVKMPAKSSLEAYFLKYGFYFRPLEILKLLGLKYSLKINDVFLKQDAQGCFFDLRTLCKHRSIPCFDVQYDIEKPEYLEKIRALKPDVIVSSNPLIFRDKILTLPSICCLNRHFAILPAYRGLLAVFHAYAQGEKHTGCSFHLMDRGIDTGTTIAQVKIPIDFKKTLHQIHQQCFDASVGCLMEALDKLRRSDFTPVVSGNAPSYYSWPDKGQWQKFRERGGRII